MKCLFVVNARSGPRRSFDVTTFIREHCQRSATRFEVRACERKEDLDEVVAQAEREHYDAVFAVGGDGTVHEVAKRLIGRDLALGILPMGSGNGFARHIRLPMDLRTTLEASFSGRIVTIDTATVNGLPFIGVLGAGFDAVVAHRFAESKRRGIQTYLVKGLAAFAEHRPFACQIEIDGQTVQRLAFVLAVANSSQYGNNARIAPLASLQDGLLDLITIDDVSFFSALPLLVRLFNGTIHKSSLAHIAQGKRIVIRREAAGPAQLDGEPVMLPAELDVRVVPSSLRVLIPASVERV